jgi:hypothetical protein
MDHAIPNNPHDNDGDDHHNGQDAVVIPLPRYAPDNDVENLPKTGSDQPVWWYDQKRKRGGDRRYSGYVNHIHGAEGERLRGEFAAVIGELLDWAAQQIQNQPDSIEDGEAA